MILPFEAVELSGRRLARLVVDRRFGQLVLFFGGGRGDLEVVYHRVDLEALDAVGLRDAATASLRLESSRLVREDEVLVHHLGFDGGVQVVVRFREAAVNMAAVG